MVLDIRFTTDGKLERVGDEVWLAVVQKMTELTDMLYNKVMENVTGKILQTKTGQLAGSIRQEVDAAGDTTMGRVFVEPANAKAWALERGGEKEYLIVAHKATVLQFFWGKTGQMAYFPYVNHPPSREFAYLRLALEEMAPLIPEELRESIQSTINGA